MKAFVQKRCISVFGRFSFLQARANFSQTGLFWHETYASFRNCLGRFALRSPEIAYAKNSVFLWRPFVQRKQKIPFVSLTFIIIHRTHYEESDWSRAFNQFTIARELDMINAISAADIAFIVSSLTSAWLQSPLECSPQKQNGSTLRFCFWGWIMWKMCNNTIIEFGFRMISWIIKTSCLCYLLQPSASPGPSPFFWFVSLVISQTKTSI